MPDGCLFRRLCTKPGTIPLGQLPISLEERTIRNAFNRHTIVAIKAEPAAGKSTQVPAFIYKALRCSNPRKRPRLCIVQKSVYACRKVKQSLVEVFHWQGHRIQLKTAKDTEAFSKGKKELSIINYGILWEWMTSTPSILRRYDALLLDEWADTGPKQREMGRTIRHMMQSKELPDDFSVGAYVSGITESRRVGALRRRFRTRHCSRSQSYYGAVCRDASFNERTPSNRSSISHRRNKPWGFSLR